MGINIKNIIQKIKSFFRLLRLKRFKSWSTEKEIKLFLGNYDVSSELIHSFRELNFNLINSYFCLDKNHVQKLQKTFGSLFHELEHLEMSLIQFDLKKYFSYSNNQDSKESIIKEYKLLFEFFNTDSRKIKWII